jgi:carbon storage regulator
MLVLSRKKNESIVINGCIRVTVVDTGNNTVRIGIDAPRDVEILRSELLATENVAPQKPLAVTLPVTHLEGLCDFAI